MRTFTEYHLRIDKQTFDTIDYAPLGNGQWLAEITPDLTTYISLLSRVGGYLDWDKRPDEAAHWHSDISNPASRLHLFGYRDQVIGYCFSGEPKQSLQDHYTRAVQNLTAIEIKNVGFFPEYTKQGHGQAFLPAMFGVHFANHDKVVLSTRSTNHNRVVPFYESLGMEVTHQIEKPDDITGGYVPTPRRTQQEMHAMPM